MHEPPDIDPAATAARLETYRRRHALGPDAACIVCDVTHPAALKRRSILENHHVGGKNNDPDTTVVLCLTDHAIATENQRAAGVFEREQGEHVIDRLHRWLVSLATFFLMLVDAILRKAEQVADFRDRLTVAFPEWREATA